jgi:hypothetical protein
MTKPKIQLLKHQHEFVTDITSTTVALIGGYGTGKSVSLCAKAIYLASLNIGFTGALLEPTGTMIRDILVPTMNDLLEQYKIPYDYRSSPLPEYTLRFKQGTSKILLRSAENYRRLVGANLAWVGLDEADTINKQIAWPMWRVVQSRIRAGRQRQTFIVSTPEGFQFCYELLVTDKNKESRRLIKARTEDNPFLPDSYIEDLRSSYPPQLIEAYLNGEFVNLNSATVYTNFDRKLNSTTKTLKDFDSRVALHIGMDFNINKCSSIVHIIDNNLPIAVDEIIGTKNTEQTIVLVNLKKQMLVKQI